MHSVVTKLSWNIFKEAMIKIIKQEGRARINDQFHYTERHKY